MAIPHQNQVRLAHHSAAIRLHQVSFPSFFNGLLDRDGEIISLTAAERRSHANQIADTYIRAVDKFLDENPVARPKLGETPGWASRLGWTFPVCAEWVSAMHTAFSDGITGHEILSEYYEIADVRFVPLNGAGFLEHNWLIFTTKNRLETILVDTSPGVRVVPPSSGSKVMYIDPWIDILPKLYTSESHISKNWFGAMRIGEGTND